MDFSRFDYASLIYFRGLIDNRLSEVQHKIQIYSSRRGDYTDKLVRLRAEIAAINHLSSDLDREIFIRDQISK